MQLLDPPRGDSVNLNNGELTMAQKQATAAVEKESKIEGKAGKAEKGEAKEKANRSKFGDAQIITLLVDHNPKRPKSASFQRFETSLIMNYIVTVMVAVSKKHTEESYG